MTWTAYLDESGTYDSPIMLMGGFVGDAEQWSAFDQDWQSLLTSNDIDFSHAKDLTLDVVMEDGARNNADAHRLFELAKEAHLPEWRHLLGTLTFGTKNAGRTKTQ